MKCNKWMLALIGAGLVSLPAVTRGDEAAKPVPLVTALSATTISGYVDTSAHWNLGTGNANLPVYTPNGAAGATKADGFNLDVAEITLSKPAGDELWSAGYNVTIIAGPDAVGYNNLFGSVQAGTTGAGFASGKSDFGLKDTYIDLHAPIGNPLSVKIGTFSEPLGNEVFEAGANPNYTRSYGYELEPTALTGVLGTYTLSQLTLYAGIADTWSSGLNTRNSLSSTGAAGNHAESYKTYIGMATFTAPTNMSFLAGSTISGGIISGYDAFIDRDVTSYYAGANLNTPITDLTLGFAFDALDVATESGENWAVGTYLSYALTPKLKVAGRAEILEGPGPREDFCIHVQRSHNSDHARRGHGVHPHIELQPLE